MAKISLSGSANTNAAIAANPARTALEIRVGRDGQPVRFTPAATYSDTNNGQIDPGDVRVFEGVFAQSAFSFGIAQNTSIETLEYT